MCDMVIVWKDRETTMGFISRPLQGLLLSFFFLMFVLFLLQIFQNIVKQCTYFWANMSITLVSNARWLGGLGINLQSPLYLLRPFSSHIQRWIKEGCPVPAVKLLGIMLRNRCWPTNVHTIITGDADGWCHNCLVSSTPCDVWHLSASMAALLDPQLVSKFTLSHWSMIYDSSWGRRRILFFVVLCWELLVVSYNNLPRNIPDP